MSACAAAATRRKTTRRCFRTASSERLDLIFFLRQGIARSVGWARVSKRKSQYNTHIIYWHIGVSRLRRWLKRGSLLFFPLSRWVDGWKEHSWSQVFPFPAPRPACLSRRCVSNRSSYRWWFPDAVPPEEAARVWEREDSLGRRSRWLEYGFGWFGTLGGQALLRVSSSSSSSGGMDGWMDLGREGRRVGDITVLLCFVRAGW